MSEEPKNVFETGLHQINLSGKVAKGFNCTVKAIIKKKAIAVFLADDATKDAKYKPVITGLCNKYGVRLITGQTKEAMGKALGLTHLKSDGTVRRQMGCGACAITKIGRLHTAELDEFLAAYSIAE